MTGARLATLGVGGALAAVIYGCAVAPTAEETQRTAEQMVSEAYPGMPATLTARAHQDAEQKICSKAAGEKPTAEEAAHVAEAARASLRYPAGGKLAGDWMIGERLVTNRVPLDEIQAGFDMLRSRQGKPMKMVFIP